MKKAVLFFLFFLLSVRQVAAHGPGEPPFFKINEKYADYYQVPLTASAFMLPQDAAPETYIVNDDILFEIDKEKVVIPVEIIDQATFEWDFGDGATGSGLENQHRYTQAGSYLLTIFIKTKIAGEENKQLFQSTLIHVLPDKTYKLPQAIISVNGKKSNDPIIDTLDFSLEHELAFSAEDSISQSETQEIIWDFGDGTSAKGEHVKHIYDIKNNPMTIVFVTLRTKTIDGFISDAFVQINNTASQQIRSPEQRQKHSVFPYLVGTSVVGIVLLVGFIKIGKKKI